MKKLALILALILAAPAPASAFCFSSFHQPKVEQQTVQVVNGVPVAIKTVEAKKPDSFCKTVMRSAAISVVVTTFVTTIKLGIIVLTGVPIL
jgi:hypothetical protein